MSSMPPAVCRAFYILTHNNPPVPIEASARRRRKTAEGVEQEAQERGEGSRGSLSELPQGMAAPASLRKRGGYGLGSPYCLTSLRVKEDTVRARAWALPIAAVLGSCLLLVAPTAGADTTKQPLPQETIVWTAIPPKNTQNSPQETKKVAAVSLTVSYSQWGAQATVTGALLVDGRPVAGKKITVTISGQPFGEAMTSDQGTYRVEAPIPIQSGDVVVVARFAGDNDLKATEATMQATVVPLETKLEASATPTHEAGKPFLLTGKLTDATGAPLAGQRVLAGINNPDGQDGATLTGPDGSFEISLGAPMQPGPATIHVHYDGNPPYPAARSAPIQIQISPPSPTPTPTSLTPTPRPSPTITPAITALPRTDLPPPPTLVTLWPLLLAGLLALLAAGTLAWIAWTRRHAIAQEQDATLETVSNGDLYVKDEH